MSLDKFRGLTEDRVDAVIASLTDDEWDQIEIRFMNVVNQLIIDYFTAPLGIGIEALDGTALYCRLYRMSLDRSPGA